METEGHVAREMLWNMPKTWFGAIFRLAVGSNSQLVVSSRAQTRELSMK